MIFANERRMTKSTTETVNYLLLDSVQSSEPQELAAFVVFFLRLTRDVHNGHSSLQNLAATAGLIGAHLKEK